MLISDALAQGADAAAGGGFGAILPLVLIFVVFYFLLIRPQQKKMKAHQAMLGAVRRGDKVVTGGGIIGTVAKVGEDDDITIEIAPEIKVHVRRSLIAEVVSKTQPADSNTTPANDDGAKKGGLMSLLSGKKD